MSLVLESPCLTSCHGHSANIQCHPDATLSCGSAAKNLPTDAGDIGDAGSVPGSGRSPRGGNGNPLQYSCLGNLMDRGAWRGVTKSQTRPSTHTHTHTHTQELGILDGMNDPAGEGGRQRGREEPQKSQLWSMRKINPETLISPLPKRV